MKTFFQFALLVLVLAAGGSLRADTVLNSPHNLTVTGTGSIKAASERDACIFCHTAHRSNGATPLWNHAMSGITNYVVYSSPTLQAVVGQPNGSSRLCLSCHDGTVALGSISSRTATIAMQGGTTVMPGGADNLGTDLSGDHPISFVYDANLAVKDPSVKNPAMLNNSNVRLDHYNQLQCTSCHNPHDDQYGNFLVMNNTGSALCMVCHLPPGWTGSAHALSVKASPLAVQLKAGVKFDIRRSKSASIATMGCEDCHASHEAGSRQTLLINAEPEQNCLVCHSGTTATKNIASDFQKLSIHPITLNREAHNAREDVINPPIRHVSCNDCHNPHAAHAATAKAPNVTGALAQVTGVSAAGGVITPALKEYEVCFRCHADSIARGPATVTRVVSQTNARLEFSPGNQSYHPVIAQGKNHSVPSLIAPWLTTSITYCTDCHNSDQSPAAGGSGANGPHGSIYAPILERNLSTVDFQAESSFAYALCYKCHSRSSVLGNMSFKYHSSHVVNDQTACTTCHDSHGVSGAPHLINFNTTYVTPGSNVRLEYIAYGMAHGNCSLTCHGKDHRATPY